MDMPKKRWASVAGAGAALMLLAGSSNLLFRASTFRVTSGGSSFQGAKLDSPSTWPRVVQASTLGNSAPDIDEDDSCGGTAELALAMTAWQEKQQRRTESASAAAALPEAVPAGGDIAPARYVADAYASLHSVAVDPDANQVVMSDSNRGAIFFYDRTSGDSSSKMVDPKWEIRGPRTGMMFVAGISLDTASREVFAVNNDIGDRMEVFPYGGEGNIKPKRVLSVPHGAWGVSFNGARHEVAISIEHMNSVVVYRHDAAGAEAPLRVLRGPETELADPHGVMVDPGHGEMLVANHGNYAPLTREEEEEQGGLKGGHFAMPSINSYPVEAKGNDKPMRKIQGAQTQLNWPMGLGLDAVHDEIAVANYGSNSILVFRRNANGDVAPLRVIRGDRTGILGPMGVAIDAKNDELWVTNYREHTAEVFARTANGNVAPKRTLRNAPAGAPAVGFGNPGAIAYDSKRGQILVPN
jgi:DNA-binding beta-propeller fold protein YncE